jgi:hypothetical protein
MIMDRNAAKYAIYSLNGLAQDVLAAIRHWEQDQDRKNTERNYCKEVQDLGQTIRPQNSEHHILIHIYHCDLVLM